jgi:hypothetical protein
MELLSDALSLYCEGEAEMARGLLTQWVVVEEDKNGSRASIPVSTNFLKVSAFPVF